MWFARIGLAMGLCVLGLPVAHSQTPPASSATSGSSVADGAPVDFQKLLSLIPPAPEGWTAEEPAGSSTVTPEFKLAVAGCSYAKKVGEGEQGPTASVNITDFVGNAEFLKATTSGWNEAQVDASEGYAKVLTIDGNRGFESHDAQNGTTTRWVVIRNRFLLQIEVTGLPASDLQGWFQKIDLKKLAELK